MRRTAAILTLIASLALLPVAAAAQYGSSTASPPPDEPRAQRRPAATPAPAAAVDLQQGVGCQVAHDAASLEPMLATAPYSTEERAEAVRILRLIQHCLHASGGLTTSATLLRGAIAEALYESRFAAAQAPQSPALAARSLLRPEAATTRADIATLVPSYALADCTAAFRPDLVRGLLAADPSTPAEQTAFQALGPAFSHCVTGNTQLAVDGRTLRGILAETLYRWSVVQRDGAASPLAAQPGAAAPAPTPAPAPGH